MTELFSLALIWRPYFPPLPTLTGAVFIGALTCYVQARSFRTRPVLSLCAGAMRLSLIAAITIILMGPSWLPQATQRPGRPKLTIMLDTSASMLTADVDDQSRYEFAVTNWLSARRLTELDAEFDLEIIGFDQSPRPLHLASMQRPADQVATARVSNVVSSVRDTLIRMSRTDQNALLVISDGRDTMDESYSDLAQVAAARSIPVHALCLGGYTLQRDIGLAVLPMQPYLLQSEEGELTVKVLQTNADQSSTNLHIRCGQEHLVRPIRFDGQSAVTMTLPIKQDEPGLYEYEVSVDPVDGELETTNNRQSMFIEVTSARIRVLLLEGQPYWDTKFLAQSLCKDDRIELTQITHFSARRPLQTVVSRSEVPAPKLPTTIEGLGSFDVIILGCGIEHLLPMNVARLLPTYVAKYGGRIVFARGQPYDPYAPKGQLMGDALSVLEPVVWGQGMVNDQQISLEPAGLDHPSFTFATAEGDAQSVIRQLPPISVTRTIGREKPATSVLLRTRRGTALAQGRAGRPVLVTMPYERGLVVAMLGEGLWRWSLADDNDRLAGAFDQFWSNMIRWLALGGEFQPGKNVSIRLSRRIVQVGEAITIDVSSRLITDGAGELQMTVIDPNGQRHVPALVDKGGSRRQAEYEPQELGLYSVVVDTPGLDQEPVVTKFGVYDVDFERLLSAVNRQGMRLLAQQSGGLLLDAHHPEKLADLLRRYHAAMIVPPQPRYLWDRGWILVLILVAAGSEWIIRKKGGLL